MSSACLAGNPAVTYLLFVRPSRIERLCMRPRGNTRAFAMRRDFAPLRPVLPSRTRPVGWKPTWRLSAAILVTVATSRDINARFTVFRLTLSFLMWSSTHSPDTGRILSITRTRSLCERARVEHREATIGSLDPPPLHPSRSRVCRKVSLVGISKIMARGRVTFTLWSVQGANRPLQCEQMSRSLMGDGSAIFTHTQNAVARRHVSARFASCVISQ